LASKPYPDVLTDNVVKRNSCLECALNRIVAATNGSIVLERFELENMIGIQITGELPRTVDVLERLISH